MTAPDFFGIPLCNDPACNRGPQPHYCKADNGDDFVMIRPLDHDVTPTADKPGPLYQIKANGIEAPRVLILDKPGSWVRELFLNGESMYPRTMNTLYGKRPVAWDLGLEPAFIVDEAPPGWPGNMQVTGKLTTYFEDKKLWRSLCPDRRRIKRNRRVWDNQGFLYKQHSKGWRRHLRRKKAKQK